MFHSTAPGERVVRERCRVLGGCKCSDDYIGPTVWFDKFFLVLVTEFHNIIAHKRRGHFKVFVGSQNFEVFFWSFIFVMFGFCVNFLENKQISPPTLRIPTPTLRPLRWSYSLTYIDKIHCCYIYNIMSDRHKTYRSIRWIIIYKQLTLQLTNRRQKIIQTSDRRIQRSKRQVKPRVKHKTQSNDSKSDSRLNTLRWPY